ncbi:MAG: hypothetical protein ACFFC7_24075, partial [Candidatus Hermodarchaeota archaeon]
QRFLRSIAQFITALKRQCLLGTLGKKIGNSTNAYYCSEECEKKSYKQHRSGRKLSNHIRKPIK